MEAAANGLLKPQTAPTAQPTAPRLTKLSFDTVDAANALARYRGDFVFSGKDGEIRLRLCHPQALDLGDMGFARVALRIDGGAASAWLPAKALSAIAATSAGGLSIAEMSYTGRALLFEHALDGLLSHLETRGHTVSIEEIANPIPNPPGAFGFVCTFGALPHFPGTLEAAPDLLRQLLREADALPPPPRGFADLPVVIRMLAGATGLSSASYVGLQDGDTVLLDHSWMKERRVPVLAGESLLLSAHVTSRGFALDGSGPVKDLRERAIWLTDDLITEGNAMSDVDTASLDALEVKLVFEVGRFAMTMAELNRLDAGHVFELNRQPSQAVDIFVMNRQVGSGELVMVGERIGVRMTKLQR